MIDRRRVPGGRGKLDDLESRARLEHPVPETWRLHHEIAGTEQEWRSLVLVDQLRLAGEAVDQLESDRVMVHPIP